MDRILIILKKENSPRALSAPALGLNTIIFKHVHVYWYMQQISGEREPIGFLVGIYSRSQVSVYRTIGPLVTVSPVHKKDGSNARCIIMPYTSRRCAL